MSLMQFNEAVYPETRVGGFTGIDGTIAFYTRVNALVRPNSTVLDIGCGRGKYDDDPVPFRRTLRILRGKCRRVIGIDVDPIGKTNTCVDEFRLISNHRWPVEDDCIDLCLSDWCLENLPDPALFFREAWRALKPDGYLSIRTLNRLSYTGIAASLVPNHVHGFVLKHAQRDREEQDIFPTVYRCNTVARLRNAMNQQGFTSCVYGYEPEPAYLAFSKLLYRCAALVGPVTPSHLRTCIFAFGQKPRQVDLACT